METVELGATQRSTRGKGPARRLRREGKIPAVFYGPKRQATMIAIDAREFLQKVSALEGSHLVRFQSSVPSLSDKVALVKEAQYHPSTGEPLHADFYEVDMQRTLRVRVPLHFSGKAAGVTLGGILQPVQREVEVECLPGDIPEFIDVDVSSLNIHDAIHTSELQVPRDVTVCYDTDVTLVTVLPPTVEEVKVEEAAAPVEGVAAEGAPAAGAAAEPETKGEAT
ncbi:MAG: 50S ribosomal protein L25 [Candidatus Binatia bacterium]